MAINGLWMQNGIYPARHDRQFIRRSFGNREIVFDGLVVSQNGAGNVSVNISAGSATIQGDDQTDQGMYLPWNDATANLVMPAVPGSNKRIDLVSLRVNDPNAGGPAGDNFTFVVTQGAVNANPVAPTAPTSAIVLAQVLCTAGDAAVLAAQITDVAPRIPSGSTWPYAVSTGAVPAALPPNFLFIKVV
jgi:hypothetical protein